MELPALHVIIHSSGNGSTEGVAISYAHKKIETMLLKVTARFSSTFFFKLVVCVLDRGTQACFCTRFVNLPAVRSDSSDTGNQCTTDVNDDDDDDDNNNNNNNYYYYYY